MKVFLSFFLLIYFTNTPAQNPEWKIIKPTNTGIQGNYVYSIAFEGNDLWVAGDNPGWDEGGASVYNGSFWKNYSNVDGNMPSNEVHKIFIASNGDRWFSTSNGIVRLRGEVKTIFNTSNSPFPSNLITDIEEDNSGNIWVGIGQWVLNQGGGIGKYNGSTWTIYQNIYPGLPQNTPSELFFDNQNILWSGWLDGGLIKYDGTTWTFIPPDFNTFRGGTTTAIAQDEGGSIWFSTNNNGFGKLSGNNWTWWNRDNTPSLQTDGFSDILIAGNNSVYLSTYISRVYLFNGAIQQTHIWHGSHIYSMIKGPDGGIWVGGIGGVEKLIGQNPVIYTTANTGLPDRFISMINVDNLNYKWICNSGGGLSKFDGIRWRDFNPYNHGSEPWPFPSDAASQVLFDRLGNVWLGVNGGGVGKWDGTNWTRYQSGLSVNSVISIGIDSSQTIWAGVYNYGIGKLNHTTGTFSMYNTSNSGLPNNFVNAIAANLDTSIWIGTVGGLAKFKNDNWTVYRTDNSGIPNNRVNCLAKDPSGNLWIGTGNGLAKFNGATWVVYNTQNANIPADFINSVTVSSTGVVWIGCFQGSISPYTGGIAKFDGNTWTSWTTQNSPLPHNQVETVALDKLGNLWIGTASEGVAVFKEGGIITGTGNPISNINIPEEFILKQNYPNPFNPVTTIKFSISYSTNQSKHFVKLKIYDILGKEIAILINEQLASGDYETKFNGSNLNSGVYFYKLIVDDIYSETKGMILLK